MTIHERRIVCFGCLALGFLCAATPVRGQEALRYKFRPGEKLDYVFEEKITLGTTIQGNNVTMDLTLILDQAWNVVSVEKDGTAKMTQKFGVRFAMNGPFGKSEYDPKAGKVPQDPIGTRIVPLFQALSGGEFKMTVDARGQMSNIEVPDKFAEMAKKSPLPGGMGNLFSVDGIKRMVSQSGLVLPEGPIAKGGSWQKKADMKLPFGKLDVDTTYTAEGMTTRDGVKVDQFTMKPKLALEPDPKAQLTFQLKSQEGQGAAYFDPRAGRLTETDMTQKMEVAWTMGGQEFTQSIEQKTSMKLQNKGKGP